MKEKTAELLDLLEEVQVELIEKLKGRLKVGDKVRFTNEYGDRTGNFYLGAIEVDNYYSYVLVADPADIGKSSVELLRKYSYYTRDYDVAELYQIELGWTSKADMMFKAMGYEKTLDDNHNIFFEKYFASAQCTETIAFNRKYKTVEISYDKDNIVASFCMEQYLAINEKLTDLGWIDNE